METRRGKTINFVEEAISALVLEGITLREMRQITEACYVKKALEMTANRHSKVQNQCKAARMIGLHRNTLSRTIQTNPYLRDVVKKPPQGVREPFTRKVVGGEIIHVPRT